MLSLGSSDLYNISQLINCNISISTEWNLFQAPLTLDRIAIELLLCDYGDYDTITPLIENKPFSFHFHYSSHIQDCIGGSNSDIQ